MHINQGDAYFNDKDDNHVDDVPKPNKEEPASSVREERGYDKYQTQGCDRLVCVWGGGLKKYSNIVCSVNPVGKIVVIWSLSQTT